MKQLSRLGIQRMIDTSGSAGSGGSGGSDISLFGYATEAWVNENFLSIEFFSKLFKAYGPAETSGDPDVEIVPNDTESTISNIQAMFGFWTEQYLSALGQGEGGGGGGGGGGTLSNIGLVMPTGFSVSPSTLTSDGTFTVGFATGYSLPLTADVTKGVTAYAWGNHADAGYALASNVYSKTDADDKFMTIAAFERLFNALNSSGNKVSHPYSSSVDSIKALFGFWTEQYLSVLGQNSGGGGGITLNEPLASINSAGLVNHPSGSGQTIIWNGSAWVYGMSGGSVQSISINGGSPVGPNNGVISLSGLATTVKVGDTSYTASSAGVVSLPDYLKLTGGELSLSSLGGFSVNRGSNANSFVTYKGKVSSTAGTLLGYLGFSGVDTPAFRSTGGTNYTLWHAGNFTPSEYATVSSLDGYLPLTAGSGKALTGQLFFNTASKTHTIRCYDANNTSRIFAQVAYSVDSETSIQSSTMTLNSDCTIYQDFQTANTAGYQRLTLGNNTKLNAANNRYGILRLYGQRNAESPTNTVRYGQIIPDILSANMTWTLPNKNGTFAMTSDLTDFVTTSVLSSTLEGYVTLATEQTITGAKTFKSSSNVPSVINFAYGSNDGGSIYADSSARLHIDSGANENLYIGYGSSANSSTSGTLALLLTNTAFKPLNVATGVFDLGTSSGRWNGIYGASLNLTGNASVGGALTVAGNASVTGTLGVTGAATLASTLTVTDATTLNSTLTVKGTTSAQTIQPRTTTGSYYLGTSDYPWKRLYLASDVYLEYNSTNSAVHLVGAGLYVDTYLSALGANSGGGGGITLNQPLSAINNAGLGTPSVSGQAIVYNGSSWVYSGSATLKANAVSVSSSLSAYTGSFGSSLDVSAQLTVAAGNLVVTNGKAGISGSASETYNLYVHGTGRLTNLVLGNESSAGTVACTTIETLSSRGLYLKSATGLPIYASGAYSNQSDIRLKNIAEDVVGDVKSVADAPIFSFTWKDAEIRLPMLGTSAQYWQQYLPTAVMEAPNGFLSLDYGATALAAAVITARKVMDHERRIKELEDENKMLRNEINKLKAA